MKEKYVKSCPGCGCEQSYKHKGNRDKAVKLNKLCRTCCRKGVKRKPFTAETKANMSAAQKGKTLSDEHKASLTASKQKKRDAYTEMYGDKHEFPSRFYFTKWAKQVKERDSYTCKKCAKVGSGSFIHSHHIVPKEYFMARALDIDNGCTLCNGCHQQVHGELDTYVLHGKRLDEAGFINHFNEWKPNGKK